MAKKVISVICCLALLLLQVDVSDQLGAEGGAEGGAGVSAGTDPALPVPFQLNQLRIVGKLLHNVLGSLLKGLKLPPLTASVALVIPLKLGIVDLTIGAFAHANVTVIADPPKTIIWAAADAEINITGTIDPGKLLGVSLLQPTQINVVAVGINVTAKISLVTDAAGNFGLNVTACVVVIGKIDIELKLPLNLPTTAVTKLLDSLKDQLKQSLQIAICAAVRLAVDQQGLHLFAGLTLDTKLNNLTLIHWNATLININTNTIDGLLKGVIQSIPTTLNGVTGLIEQILKSVQLLLGPGGPIGGLLDGLGGVLGGGGTGGLLGGDGLLSGVLGGDGVLGGVLGGDGLLGRKKRQADLLSGLTNIVDLDKLGDIVMDITNLVKVLLEVVIRLLKAVLAILAGKPLTVQGALKELCPKLASKGEIKAILNFTVDLQAIKFDSETSATIPLSGTITFAELQENGDLEPIITIPVTFIVNMTAGVAGKVVVVGVTGIDPADLEKVKSTSDSPAACIEELLKFVVNDGLLPVLKSLTGLLGIELPLDEVANSVIKAVGGVVLAVLNLVPNGLLDSLALPALG